METETEGKWKQTVLVLQMISLTGNKLIAYKMPRTLILTSPAYGSFWIETLVVLFLGQAMNIERTCPKEKAQRN